MTKESEVIPVTQSEGFLRGETVSCRSLEEEQRLYLDAANNGLAPRGINQCFVDELMRWATGERFSRDAPYPVFYYEVDDGIRLADRRRAAQSIPYFEFLDCLAYEQKLIPIEDLV